MTPAAVGAARDLIDQVRLLHPAHDGRVRLIADFSGGRGWLVNIEVAGLLDINLPPWVVIDHPLHNAFASTSVVNLLTGLGVDLTTLRGVELAIMLDTVQVFGTQVTVDRAQLRCGDNFVQALAWADQGLDARQQAVQTAMGAPGPCTVHWNRDARVLELSNHAGLAATFGAEFIGSYAPAECSWCWGWANGSVSGELTAAITAVRDAAVRDAVTLPVLQAPGLPCSEPFAFALAHIAASRMGNGGMGIWRWPRPSGMQMFFAIDPGANTRRS
ncbi:MAG: hypothetical protein JKY37_24810 [Nannocystaceae bacterium]|nr:hypothetical protein [Nannocystaceae bacterium]